MTRSLLGIFAAVVVGYVVLGITAGLTFALGPTSWSTVPGEILGRLTMLLPHLVSAAAMGIIAALIVDTPRAPHWPFVLGAIAAVQFALGFGYIAPDWQEWAKTIVSGLLVVGAAAGAFALVARRHSLPITHFS